MILSYTSRQIGVGWIFQNISPQTLYLIFLQGLYIFYNALIKLLTPKNELRFGTSKLELFWHYFCLKRGNINIFIVTTLCHKNKYQFFGNLNLAITQLLQFFEFFMFSLLQLSHFFSLRAQPLVCGKKHFSNSGNTGVWTWN